MDQYFRNLARRLGAVEHFKGLTDQELLEIITSGQIRRFTSQEVIYVEDEPSLGLFVLLSGRVQICKLSQQGQISILGIFEPIIMFNEVAALDGGQTPATAIALEDTIVWQMASDSLEKLVLKYPRVGLGIARVLAARNRRLVGQFQDLSFRSNLSRAAKLLLEISKNGATPIDRRKHPNHLMASQIATVPEAFSRSLKVFRCSGLIRTDAQHITVLHAAGLFKVAQVGPRDEISQ